MPGEPEKKSGQEPNLELPSLLGFGRKKKKGKSDSVADKPAPDEAVTADSVTEQPAATDAAVDSDDPRAADPVPQPKSGLAPATHRAKRPPPVPPPPATRQEPEVPPEPEVVREPEVRQEPEVPPQPEVVREPEARQEPEIPPEPEVAPEPEVRRRPWRWSARRDTEETTVIETVPPEQPVAATAAEPVSEPAPAVPSDPPAANRADGPVHEGQVSWADEDPINEPVNEPVAGGARRARAPRPRPTLPVINPRLAAALTGGVVGLVGVALTSVAGRGCEVIRGVGSCGGIGLLALLVILALEIMLGAVILKAWRLSDPTSTSFLGVGLAAVFVLLFLLSSLESVWMFLVIPLLTVATFVLSWLITETFAETGLDDLHR